MLKPKNKKKDRVKLSKESVQKAKRIFSYLKPYRLYFFFLFFFLVFIFLFLSFSALFFFSFLLDQLIGSYIPSEPSTQRKQEFLKGIKLNNINIFSLFFLFLLIKIGTAHVLPPSPP